MATALFSAISGEKVRSDIAMTGEITLRGRVLPVGGTERKDSCGKNGRYEGSSGAGRKQKGY